MLHVHVSSTCKSIRSHFSWFRLLQATMCFFCCCCLFVCLFFFNLSISSSHVDKVYIYNNTFTKFFIKWNCVLTCAQGPSWGTKLSLVQTQVPCTSQYHDVRQELSTQWLWMLKIFLFPDSKIIIYRTKWVTESSARLGSLT